MVAAAAGVAGQTRMKKGDITDLLSTELAEWPTPSGGAEADDRPG